MLTNYLKTVFRNIRRRKGYGFINLAGLAIGIAACFVIFLWVRDELSYDRFHDKAKRIYRVLWDGRYGDNSWTIPLVPIPVAGSLREQFPEVEAAARLLKTSRTLRISGENITEQDFFLVENAFFDIFSVTFLAGDPQTALRDPGSVVITQETARRYFPRRNPMGQMLELSDGTTLKITGIVKSFPAQSHFHFDFLAPLRVADFNAARRTSWSAASVYTYLTLKPGSQPTKLEAKLREYIDKEGLAGELFSSGNNYSRFLLQSLTNIHLHSHLQYELEPNGNIVYVRLFAVVGIFILLLACINFINLATARYINRLREVGIRKVLGARRRQLIRQFFFETFLYVFLAAILAAIVTEMALPLMNTIAGKQLSVGYLTSPYPVLLLSGITLMVTLLAGSYPALFLSSFRPVKGLRSRLTFSPRRDNLRDALVVLQFCISTGLIAGTLVVYGQLRYVQNKQLGFDKEHVLVIEGVGSLGDRFSVFKEQVEGLAGVVTASAAQSLPGRSFDSMPFQMEQPANYEETSFSYNMVDEHFVEAMGLHVVQGRNFSPASFPTDSMAFLINASAAEALGWSEPVGRRLNYGYGWGPVIGVVEDFHFQSLHEEIKPLILPFIRWQPQYIAIRLQPGSTPATVAAVRHLWNKFYPNHPFAYSFLDKDYQQLYKSERGMAKLFSIFSGLSIFIACLGLFGLAAYAAEYRTKEIGIRKVVGATIAQIIMLLNRDFLKLVLIGLIIAMPAAWYAMTRWLENFAYHIHLRPWVFLLAGGITMVIALLTVSYQSVKAALANPASTLRYE